MFFGGKDTLIFTDGSLGFAIELTPIDVSCFDESRINEFSSQARRFLGATPENTHIQFVQEILPGNDKTINCHQRLGEDCRDQLVKNLIERLMKYWNWSGLQNHYGKA